VERRRIESEPLGPMVAACLAFGWGGYCASYCKKTGAENPTEFDPRDGRSNTVLPLYSRLKTSCLPSSG